MQKRYWMCLISVVVLGVTLAGCTGPTRLEMDYGNSHRLARAQQLLAPEAERNLTPVEGLDGEAARRSLEHYRKTFEKPPPPPTFAISVGDIK